MNLSYNDINPTPSPGSTIYRVNSREGRLKQEHSL
jgi:hypothetical protein